MRHKILGEVSDLDFFLDNMSKEKRPHKIHVKMAMCEKYAFLSSVFFSVFIAFKEVNHFILYVIG